MPNNLNPRPIRLEDFEALRNAIITDRQLLYFQELIHNIVTTRAYSLAHGSEEIIKIQGLVEHRTNQIKRMYEQ
jgi:hypothetical protein